MGGSCPKSRCVCPPVVCRAQIRVYVVVSYYCRSFAGPIDTCFMQKGYSFSDQNEMRIYNNVSAIIKVVAAWSVILCGSENKEYAWDSVVFKSLLIIHRIILLKQILETI